ncbi:protein IMPACT homolog isoform X3 [Convolutriloba macropyga]|uniref:protein IMPACT homolog isoform X3 n=1 Tax=Convolutriloba macropyga TaxID=536237 RepID=UPI003F52354D
MKASWSKEVEAELDACLELQQDEIAALEAIYDTSWQCIDLNKFEIEISSSESARCSNTVRLTVNFTPTYPINEPPLFELSAPWMKSTEKEVLQDILIDCYLSNYKEPVVFKWITEIKDFAESCLQSRKEGGNKQASQNRRLKKEDSPESFILPSLTMDTLLYINDHTVSSEIILERKSYFQGHCITVRSLIDVDNFMIYLRSIPKIAKATHNIMAYRFTNEQNVLYTDYDEDDSS